MYFLKLENAEDMGDGQSLVTTNGMTFMVPADMVTTQQEAPNTALLEHMQRLTSHIEGLSQPPNLSPQRVPEPISTPTAAPDPQAGTRQEQPTFSPEELESLGISNKQVNAPFRVNEEATPRDIVSDAIKLNTLYKSDPSRRRQVISRIAGMVRGDMLSVKDHLCSELRRAVLGNILGRDSLKTSVVPPDLSAFVDDRPLHETLGSRQWDPGSEQAKDNISSNWINSQSVMDNIAESVDDSEFSHMYPSTSDVAVNVNRKFSGASKSKQ
tara:strand:+ start:953 stop:1759 length:807 start_codon:yes stop_codon:yes gene_type:complete